MSAVVPGDQTQTERVCNELLMEGSMMQAVRVSQRMWCGALTARPRIDSGPHADLGPARRVENGPSGTAFVSGVLRAAQ